MRRSRTRRGCRRGEVLRMHSVCKFLPVKPDNEAKQPYAIAMILSDHALIPCQPGVHRFTALHKPSRPCLESTSHNWRPTGLILTLRSTHKKRPRPVRPPAKHAYPHRLHMSCQGYYSRPSINHYIGLCTRGSAYTPAVSGLGFMRINIQALSCG